MNTNEPVQNQTEEKSKTEQILEQIMKLYPSFKGLERKKEVTKKALKFQYNRLAEEEDVERLTIAGMHLHHKRKATYTWKKETLNEEVEDTGGLFLLAKAKKIDKHVCSFIRVLLENEQGETEAKSLKHFAFEPEQYVRPYPKRRIKTEVEGENMRLDHYFDSLVDKPMEDVVTTYKLDKLNYEEAKQQYEDLKKALLDAMLKEGATQVFSDIGKFAILEKEPQYDVYALKSHQFVKQLAYHIVYTDGRAEVTDLFSKEKISTEQPDFTLDYHELSLSSDSLTVDGQPLYWESQDDGSFLATGETEIDGELLLRQLSFSTKKVDFLIDGGYLHPKTLERFRYIAQEDDLNTHFEIIEEDTHNARIEMFMRRHGQRAETLRCMQEQARDVLDAL